MLTFQCEIVKSKPHTDCIIIVVITPPPPPPPADIDKNNGVKSDDWIY
jgi:hypothetical protein